MMSESSAFFYVFAAWLLDIKNGVKCEIGQAFFKPWRIVEKHWGLVALTLTTGIQDYQKIFNLLYSETLEDLSKIVSFPASS